MREAEDRPPVRQLLGLRLGRGRFDKGSLAMAQIGLMWAGQKPARLLDQHTGHRPLSNLPLRLLRANRP